MTMPNILLIHADQHRGDCLGVENHPVLETPTLDNLAYGGARFSHFYSACPSCIATRRSLMFGQSPQRHGLVGYRENNPVPDEVLSLPEVLRRSGYQTAHVGRSMHQSPTRKRYGFEEMELVTSAHRNTYCEYSEWFRMVAPAGTDYQHHYGSGIMHNDWTAQPWHLPEHMHPTNWSVDRALRFMERRDPTRPYFLSVGFIAPHPPFMPLPFYLDRYLRTGVPDPVIGDWEEEPCAAHLSDSVAPDRVSMSPEAQLSARAGYYALINQIDTQLRRLLNPITGIVNDGNTVVIYLSDHGEMLGDHYGWRKSRAYECSARVPLLMKIPDALGGTRGVVCDAPATHADLMPTILDMLGIEIPDTVDGTSFYPQLRGDSPAQEPAPIHIEHTPYHHALTDGQQKFIWNPQSGDELFFDLQKDPQECHNAVADAEYAEAVDAWRGRLIDRLAERPEGFVREGQLCVGTSMPVIIPGSQADLG